MRIDRPLYIVRREWEPEPPQDDAIRAKLRLVYAAGVLIAAMLSVGIALLVSAWRFE
jgi:hypothetical protein